MNDSSWYDFEDLDWDDEDDEEGNYQHCLGADHLGEDPKRVVDELLAEEPIRSKLRLGTAEFALVGPNAARDTLWLDCGVCRLIQTRRLASADHWLAGEAATGSGVGASDWQGMEAITVSDDARERERELREELDRTADNAIIEGSGEPLPPRRLGHMVSLRLEPEFAAQLRELADRRGMSLSELLREGAALLLMKEYPSPRWTYHYVVFGAYSFDGRTAAAASELSLSS